MIGVRITSASTGNGIIDELTAELLEDWLAEEKEEVAVCRG